MASDGTPGGRTFSLIRNQSASSLVENWTGLVRAGIQAANPDKPDEYARGLRHTHMLRFLAHLRAGDDGKGASPDSESDIRIAAALYAGTVLASVVDENGNALNGSTGGRRLPALPGVFPEDVVAAYNNEANRLGFTVVPVSIPDTPNEQFGKSYAVAALGKAIARKENRDVEAGQPFHGQGSPQGDYEAFLAATAEYRFARAVQPGMRSEIDARSHFRGAGLTFLAGQTVAETPADKRLPLPIEAGFLAEDMNAAVPEYNKWAAQHGKGPIKLDPPLGREPGAKRVDLTPGVQTVAFSGTDAAEHAGGWLRLAAYTPSGPAADGMGAWQREEPKEESVQEMRERIEREAGEEDKKWLEYEERERKKEKEEEKKPKRRDRGGALTPEGPGAGNDRITASLGEGLRPDDGLDAC